MGTGEKGGKFDIRRRLCKKDTAAGKSHRARREGKRRYLAGGARRAEKDHKRAEGRRGTTSALSQWGREGESLEEAKSTDSTWGGGGTGSVGANWTLAPVVQAWRVTCHQSGKRGGETSARRWENNGAGEGPGESEWAKV